MLATCCLQQVDLDAVWFVPAAKQPLKPQGPIASDVHRLSMLQCVADDEAEFQVSTIELDRGGSSYTVDTLKRVQREQPQAELFLLMGADSLAKLTRWHQAADVCRLATPVVLHRAGYEQPGLESFGPIVPAQRLKWIRENRVEMPATPISSTQIRNIVAAQGKWDNLVPPKVARYIRQHHLYVAQDR